MKILEKSFRKKGFFHEQVYRQGEYAIYKRVRTIKEANSEHFELILIKNHPAYELAGVKFEEGESYPSSEQWGTLGWTLPTFEIAMEKLKIVKQHQKELAAAAKERKK